MWLIPSNTAAAKIVFLHKRFILICEMAPATGKNGFFLYDVIFPLSEKVSYYRKSSKNIVC